MRVGSGATDAPVGYAENNFLNHTKGFASWIWTLDHKRIGVMYMWSIILFFFAGGLFATMLRTELWTPKDDIVGPDLYNQLFTYHGAVMVFLVILPGIPAALANFVLPIMLGAKDVAFPKLNLASYWLFVVGALLALSSLVQGGLDTGWTFYTPYSTSTNTAVVPVVTAAFILGFANIFTGLNFIVTIHKLRPPGMGWFNMPLFLWGIYATGIIQVLATPVLGITLLLLIIERVFHVGIFDPALGGDPVLFQHFFWFYSHPAVYIMILPAMAVISEMVPTFSRKPIFGYRFIAYSSIAIALFGFLVWGHHMFVAGQSALMNMIMSALTYSVSIPSAVKVFNWLATMWKGSIQYRTPMIWVLGFIWIFAIGGLTGLFLGSLGTDVHLHETYFVVAHFHYTMMGSTFLAFFGGVFYWWPKMFGRMYDEKWGTIGALIVNIGFNATFIPQFIMGSHGSPRRYAHYLPEYQPFHQASTVGTYIMLVGFIICGWVLISSLYRGRKAPANPWGASTLEWQCTSPPPYNNFDEPPIVPEDEPYHYDHLEWDPELGGYIDKRREGSPAPGAAVEAAH
ncbi:cbb3-type cytochrome c oxidase subunit I [bacterium]|nr:cbb3-type cytochrome c oxidase subunit I [bacterium]